MLNIDDNYYNYFKNYMFHSNVVCQSKQHCVRLHTPYSQHVKTFPEVYSSEELVVNRLLLLGANDLFLRCGIFIA